MKLENHGYLEVSNSSNSCTVYGPTPRGSSYAKMLKEHGNQEIADEEWIEMLAWYEEKPREYRAFKEYPSDKAVIIVDYLVDYEYIEPLGGFDSLSAPNQSSHRITKYGCAVLSPQEDVPINIEELNMQKNVQTGGDGSINTIGDDNTNSGKASVAKQIGLGNASVGESKSPGIIGKIWKFLTSLFH